MAEDEEPELSTQLIKSVFDGKKLGPAAPAVDKVDYTCRNHRAYHASSNLRSGNGDCRKLR
jgi:hypothetical protein